MRKLNLAVVLYLTVIISGCSDGGSAYKKDFMAGCTMSGGKKSTCSCIFDQLQKKYTDAEMAHLELILVNPSSASTADKEKVEGFVDNMVQSALICQ